MNKEAWQAKIEAARECHKSLLSLAKSPLDEIVEADHLLQQWTALAESMNVNEIQGDPSFAEAYLDELRELNIILREVFIKRRDALSEAHQKQQKVQAGINAYHNQTV